MLPATSRHESLIFIVQIINMRRIEQRILSFIDQYVAKHGVSPTLDEIAAGVGYRSRGSVHRYVGSLIEQGFVENRGGHRGLRSTGKIRQRFALPLLGRIAAGRPIEAIMDSEELDVTGLFAGPGRFVLQVSGDSMIEAGIHDGDYVVLQHTESAQNGDIIVALIDEDEATLKRFRRLGDGCIRLSPENRSLQPIDYAPERLRIQGVLVGQMRTYR